MYLLLDLEGELSLNFCYNEVFYTSGSADLLLWEAVSVLCKKLGPEGHMMALTESPSNRSLKRHGCKDSSPKIRKVASITASITTSKLCKSIHHHQLCPYHLDGSNTRQGMAGNVLPVKAPTRTCAGIYRKRCPLTRCLINLKETQITYQA